MVRFRGVIGESVNKCTQTTDMRAIFPNHISEDLSEKRKPLRVRFKTFGETFHTHQRSKDFAGSLDRKEALGWDR